VQIISNAQLLTTIKDILPTPQSTDLPSMCTHVPETAFANPDGAEPPRKKQCLTATSTALQPRTQYATAVTELEARVKGLLLDEYHQALRVETLNKIFVRMFSMSKTEPT
jgi:hypothetical protein